MSGTIYSIQVGVNPVQIYVSLACSMQAQRRVESFSLRLSHGNVAFDSLDGFHTRFGSPPIPICWKRRKINAAAPYREKKEERLVRGAPHSVGIVSIQIPWLISTKPVVQVPIL